MLAMTGSRRNAQDVEELVQKEHSGIGRAGLGVFPGGTAMPTRSLSDHELVWMLSGRASLTGDEPRELSAGDVLLLAPGVRHGIAWHGGRRDAPTRHGYLHFDAEAVGPVLPTGTRLVRATADDPLSGLCAYLLWLGTTASPADPLVRRTLDLLLELVVGAPLPGQPGPPALPTPVEVAFAWLGEQWARHPLRPVSVTELAAAAAVSRPHLTRLCRGALGTGPAALLALLRCARAEDLLRHTDLPVAEVARQCGYADPAHLSHQFQEILGVAPRDYRRRVPADTALDRTGVRSVAYLVWG
jgi:AraC-like DNA-binding protein